MIAKKLGLPKEKIDEVREASLLHDIGKIAIEKEILNKPGPLTKREFERIIHHPDIGSRILNQSRAFRSLVPAIRHHHERYAGGGYPNPKMKKRRIPLYARIISIADAWDAMRSDRAYRRALTRRQAMTEMRRCAGIQFDPELANIFLGII
jgi:HD-GYP domain-containing protein (c-di-GMP phosphodiesterase class II)